MTKARSYGEAVRRLLDELGWTSYKLGQAAGVNSASMSYILTGKREPALDTMEKLLLAAGKNWAWLDANKEPIEFSPHIRGPMGRPPKVKAAANGKKKT
jgi:transcriptional regulator with XRE-family HTH domain